MVTDGRLVNAIKAYRDRTGVDLKTAKQLSMRLFEHPGASDRMPLTRLLSHARVT